MKDTVLRLAEVYHDQAQLLEENEKCVPSSVAGECKDWSQDLRIKQAAVLRDVLKMEKTALELIEVIMEGCGIKPYVGVGKGEKSVS